MRTVTGPDGYVVTTDYDVFDRPTRVTYPDGTYEETTYDRLDVAMRRDRLGRITRVFHDALRRATGTRDPAGRLIGALVDDAPGLDDTDWSSLAESADPMQITPDGPNL